MTVKNTPDMKIEPDERLYSGAAEAAVIGSIIIDNNCLKKVATIIGVESFGFPEHRIIYQAILDLRETDSPIDGLIVRQNLEENGRLEQIGGVEYLSEILDNTPSSANAEYYTKIVLEKSYQRRLASGLEQMQKILESDTPVGESVTLIQAIAASLQIAVETELLISTTAASIAPEKIKWLWGNKIPSGTLTIIAGDPGSGKSFLSLYLAAQVSRGGIWPDVEKPAAKGSVILIGDEDDPAKVIIPRLIAHKADRRKIEIVSGQQGKGFFCITIHLNLLDNLLKQIDDCRLVVIDPITAYLGATNANSNAEVRSVLAPLVNLAAERNVTIIGINHFNKKQGESYIYRGLGSTAFVAQSRSSWGIMIDKDDREMRIFCPIKSNYCIEPTGLKFRIIDGAIQFEPEPWTGHIDDAGNEGTSRLNEAADWLKQRLEIADMSSNTVFEEGAEKGFSRNLLFRAKEKTGVRASKNGFGGKWFWSLNNGE